MSAPKKLIKRTYITTILEETQYEKLRKLAFRTRKPMAELLRKALDEFLKDEKVGLQDE